MNVSFPGGRKVKSGDFLKVVVETSRPKTTVRLCFDRKVGREGCFLLKLTNQAAKSVKIPLKPPKVYYQEE